MYIDKINDKYPKDYIVFDTETTGLYMKYGYYRKELEKVTDENKFKSFNMKRDEDGDIVCPAGHKFTLIKTKISI